MTVINNNVVRYTFYAVLLYFSNHYLIKYNLGWELKLVYNIISLVIAELLYKKGYTTLFFLLIIYRLLVFLPNFAIPYLIRIFEDDAYLKMIKIPSIQFGLDFLYASVHISAWWYTYKRVPPKIKYIIYTSLAFFGLNLIIQDSITRVIIHSFSLFVAYYWFTRSKLKGGSSNTKEMILIWCYLTYSIILINSEIIGAKNYTMFTYSYSIILLTALFTIKS